MGLALPLQSLAYARPRPFFLSVNSSRMVFALARLSSKRSLAARFCSRAASTPPFERLLRLAMWGRWLPARARLRVFFPEWP